MNNITNSRIVMVLLIISIIVIAVLIIAKLENSRTKLPTLNIEYVLDSEDPFNKKTIIVPLTISNDYVQYRYKNSNHIDSDSIYVFNICFKKND